MFLYTIINVREGIEEKEDDISGCFGKEPESFTFTFDSAQGVFMVLSRTANKTGNLNCREKKHTHNQRVKPSNLTRIGSKVIHFLLRPEHKNGKKTTFAANAVGPLTGLERTQKLPMTFTVCCLDCCGTKWHYTGVNCA